MLGIHISTSASLLIRSFCTISLELQSSPDLIHICDAMTPSTLRKYTPRQVLEKFYEAERVFTSAPAGQRDFGTIAEVLSDRFYMEQSSALPWAGEYHGPQELNNWLEKVSEWTVIDVRNPQIFENSDSDQVVVLSTVYYTCHKTKEKIDFPLSQTFVIDCKLGQIKEIRSFYWDILKLNNAMGYSG